MTQPTPTVLRVYTKQSDALEELRCAVCGETFENDPMRQISVHVRQFANNQASFQIEQIHSSTCLPERDRAAEEMELKQVRIPRRCVRQLLQRTHEAYHLYISRKHSVLLECCRNYKSGMFVFWPGWSETDRELPSYNLVIRGSESAQIDKTFYTCAQFKAQFTRIYHMHVSLVETNVAEDLAIPVWFKQWHERIRNAVATSHLTCDWTVWTHLAAPPEATTASVHFSLHVSVRDTFVRPLYDQMHADPEFAWNQTLTNTMQLRDPKSRWDVVLKRQQNLIDDEYQFFVKLLDSTDQRDTIHATCDKSECQLLTYSQAQYTADPQLCVKMNYQLPNEEEIYYMFDTDIDHLFAFKGELEDGLPLIVTNLPRLLPEMEMAQLTRHELPCLKQQFKLLNGKLTVAADKRKKQSSKQVRFDEPTFL